MFKFDFILSIQRSGVFIIINNIDLIAIWYLYLFLFIDML